LTHVSTRIVQPALEQSSAGIFISTTERRLMQILRHAHEVLAYLAADHDQGIKALIHTRMDELASEEGTAMEEVVFFIILDAHDERSGLESVLGPELMTPDGFPLWEVIEEHNTCYELVFVLSSSGYGALVFVPKQDPAPDVLALCQQHVHRSPPNLSHDAIDASTDTAHRGGFLLPVEAGGRHETH
jgi:hypothetical protein